MAQTAEICFVIGPDEFIIKGSKLRKSSKYFEDLLETSQEFSEIRLILPDWIKLRPFKVYLSYIETNRIPKLDLLIAQKLLWLGDFFKDVFLQTSLITNHILPFLNKETVLLFVQDTCTKIFTSSEVPECWFDLFRESCLFAAKNLKYLLGETFEVFVKLDRMALKQIFEQAAGLESFSDFLPKLQEIKNVNGLMELVEDLENEAVEEFNRLADHCLVYEWKIEDFEFGNFYKETEPFKIGLTEWVLCIWCFEHEKKLEISLKLAEVKKEIKQKLSVITSVVLVQNEVFSDFHPTIVPIPAYSQNAPIIREISSLHLESLTNFSIRFFASSQEVISAILEEVIYEPELLLKENKTLSEQLFQSVLASKYLKVESEDLVLEILAQWVEKNLGTKENMLQRLNDCILWEFVSVKQLIFVAFNYQVFKKIPIFQCSIKKELENKGKKQGSKSYSEEISGARKSYSKKIKKECYSNQKEYFGTIFDLVLNMETKVRVRQENNKVEDLSVKLENAEREIELLRSVENQGFSPIPQFKMQEEENSIALTPANQTMQLKSRNSSSDGFMIKSIEGFGKNKFKKACDVIGELVSKLKSTRKYK